MDMKILINRFEDGSILEYRNGKFNDFCIYYIISDKEECINSVTYLKRIEIFSKYNNIKRLNDAIDEIYMIESPIKNKLELERIISKYIFLPNKLFWAKVSYLILSMYFADDNWPDTKLGRSIAHARTKRVLVLKEDVDSVVRLFNGKSVYELKKIIEDTQYKVDGFFNKERQISLFDY